MNKFFKKTGELIDSINLRKVGIVTLCMFLLDHFVNNSGTYFFMFLSIWIFRIAIFLIFTKELVVTISKKILKLTNRITKLKSKTE